MLLVLDCGDPECRSKIGERERGGKVLFSRYFLTSNSNRVKEVKGN